MNVGWKKWSWPNLWNIISGWFLRHFHIWRVICTQYSVWPSHVRVTCMCTVVSSGGFFHQFTFCAIIPSHQIVGTYQCKILSTCILPVQDINMYMYIRKKFPTRNIQDWQQSSMKAGCWGLHVFKLQMKDIRLFLIRSGKPIQTG